jgi:PII-like signaling protein
VIDATKLIVWFGERDRVRHTTSAEAIARASMRAGIQTAVLLRGSQGFGSRGAVLSDQMLTLSEDLPLVWTAVGTPDRIGDLADEIANLVPQGLITQERCVIVDDRNLPAGEGSDQIKLTATVGRGQRSAGRLAYMRVVEHLKASGVDGAYVVVGVDGITHGIRHKARLVGTNAAVPAQIVAIGNRRSTARSVHELYAHGAPSLVTVERVTVLKRDGAMLMPAPQPSDRPSHTDAAMRKITLVTREDAVVDDVALYLAAIRAAQRAGLGGGTAINGAWGYAGTASPHGDAMLRLRRSIPVICVFIDTPEAIARLWPELDRLTAHGGLVTAEWVPAARAHGPGGLRGIGFDGDQTA